MTTTKGADEEMGEAEKVLASGGARMSAEQRRLSAAQRRRATPPPRSPPPSVETLRFAAEASRQVVCCGHWQMGWAEFGKMRVQSPRICIWTGSSMDPHTSTWKGNTSPSPSRDGNGTGMESNHPDITLLSKNIQISLLYHIIVRI